jgi:hypothetical protein
LLRVSIGDGGYDDQVMSAPTPDPHEFVVPPELAEVAERLGLPWHVGDRVRFEGEGGADDPASRESWPPPWVGSIGGAEPDLGERAREVMRAELGS